MNEVDLTQIILRPKLDLAFKAIVQIPSQTNGANFNSEQEEEEGEEEEGDDTEECDEVNKESDTDDEDGEEAENNDKINDLYEEALLQMMREGFEIIRKIVKDLDKPTCVYEAVDSWKQTRVCIKFVQMENDCSEVPREVRILEHVRREQEKQQLNSCSYIQELLSAFRNQKGMWAIVTRYHVKHSLRKTMYGQSLQIQRLMHQLLKAVDFLHNIGIMHRDIKLDNLLWDNEQQHLMLCDFDVATFICPNGRSKIRGTKGFIAPEILAQKRDVPNRERYNEKCDSYSIGVVYACLHFGISSQEMTENTLFSLRARMKKNEMMQSLLEHDAEERWSPEEVLEQFFVIDDIDKENMP
jgi:serine/threonine protein kinase